MDSLWQCGERADLLNGMKVRLEDLSDRKLRYLLLTCSPLKMSASAMMKRVNCSYYEAEQALRLRRTRGVFTHPDWAPTRLPLSQTIRQKVKDFYLGSQNGSMSPDPRETVMVTEYHGGEKTDTACFTT